LPAKWANLRAHHTERMTQHIILQGGPKK